MVLFNLMSRLNYLTTDAEILHEIAAGNMLSDGTNPDLEIGVVFTQYNFYWLQFLLKAG